jgi:hypothetical protein
MLLVVAFLAALAVAAWASLSGCRLDPAGRTGWRRRVIALAAMMLSFVLGTPPARAQAGSEPMDETLRLDHPLWQEVRTAWHGLDDLDAAGMEGWEGRGKELVEKMKSRLDTIVAGKALTPGEAEILLLLYDQAVYHRLRSTCQATCYKGRAGDVTTEPEMDIRHQLCELQARAEKGEITAEAAGLARQRLEQVVEFDARVRELGSWQQDPKQEALRQAKVQELDALWGRARKGEPVTVDPTRARVVARLVRLLIEPVH